MKREHLLQGKLFSLQRAYEKTFWLIIRTTLVSQYIGDDFVSQNNAAVLKVPGIIVPLAFNYLINPQHPDAGKISVVDIIPLNFDQRIKQAKKRS